MKKNNKNLLILLSAGLLPVTLMACNKDNNIKTSQDTNNLSFDGELTQTDESTSQKELKNFIVKGVELLMELNHSNQTAAIIKANRITDKVAAREFSIPESLNNGYEVVRIGEGAFKELSESGILWKCSIPKTIKIIERYAFEGFENLRDLKIGGENIFVESFAFKDCKGLTSIDTHQSRGICSKDAFYGCNKLRTPTVRINVDGRILNDPPPGHIWLRDKVGEGLIGNIAEINQQQNMYYTTADNGGNLYNDNTLVYWLNREAKTAKVVDVIDKESLLKYATIPGVIQSGGVEYKVDGIYENAFKDCNNLELVEIKGNIEEIGKEAFANCRNLEGIRLGSDVKIIKKEAFKDTPKLRTVQIYGDLTIEKDAFKNNNIVNIIVFEKDKINQFVCDEFGKRTNIPYTGEIKNGPNQTIFCEGKYYLDDIRTEFNIGGANVLCDLDGKAGTAAIVNICENSRDIKILQIPEFLEYENERFKIEVIDSEAFSNCLELEVVTIEDDLIFETESFKNCKNLKKIIINKDCYVYKNAFKGCPIVEVYYGHNLLQEEIKFASVDDLKTYTGEIKNGPSINVLANVEPEIETQKFKIGKGVEIECEINHQEETATIINITSKDIDLDTLYIPGNLDNGYKVIKIASKAFASCEKIKEFNIPATVETVEEGAFVDCKSLESVYFNGASLIEPAAFLNCKSLKEINGLDELVIFKGALSDVNEELNIFRSEIDNAVKSESNNNYSRLNFDISRFAPQYNVEKKDGSKFTNGELIEYNRENNIYRRHVGNIKKSKLLRDDKLVYWLDEENKTAKVVDVIYRDTVKDIVVPEVINGYKVIGIYKTAFKSCSQLESVVIQKNIEEIGKEAFSYCKKLVEVEIGPDVKVIQKNAFESCKDLKKVKVNNNLMVEKDAFGSRNKIEVESLSDKEITKLKADGINLYEDDIKHGPGERIYIFLEDATEDEKSQNNKEEPVVLERIAKEPEKKETKDNSDDVKKIEIQEKEEIKEVDEFVDEKTGIRYRLNHSKQEAEIIGVTDKGEKLPENLDIGALKVEHSGVEYKITSIGTRAFVNCERLKTVVIPGNIGNIKKRAFEQCVKLNKLLITGNNMIVIHEEAFFNCLKLSKLEIHEAKVAINKKAFWNCQELDNIIIDNGRQWVYSANYEVYNGTQDDSANYEVYKGELKNGPDENIMLLHK